MKEVRKMGKMAAVVALAMLAGAEGWGQGTRAVVSRTPTGIGAATATGTSVLAGSGQGSRMLVKRIRPDSRRAMRVEFTGGREIRASSGNPVVSYILPDESEMHVGIIEHNEVDPPAPEYRFHYYDASGRELWSTDICCSSGGQMEQRIQISEDGSVVAILDTGAGETCEYGERGYPAPPGCVGLRIFTGEGREIYRARQADEVSVSPRGKYVIYATNGYKDIFQLHVASGKAEKLPKPEGTRLSRVASDDGVVMYGMRKKIGPPIYRYVPGKGLEKVRD